MVGAGWNGARTGTGDRAFCTGGDQSARDALMPVLVGFALVVLSLPLFALIWGARPSDLAEAWSRAQQGFSFGGVRLSPMAMLTFVIVFAIGYSLTSFVQGAFRSSILPKTRLDTGGQNAVVSMIGYVGLALAAVAPQRVAGVTALSTPAPLDAEGLDWFAGAGPLPTGETRAAMEGREALVTFLDQPHEFDITMFHLKDIQAMRGPWWEWQQKVADPSGTEGVVGDDLALVAPWGFDLAAITTPVRLVHGEHDTFVPVAHARWLADRIPGARLEAVPGGGISTIARVEDALARLNG